MPPSCLLSNNAIGLFSALRLVFADVMEHLRWQDSFVATPIIALPPFASGSPLTTDDYIYRDRPAFVRGWVKRVALDPSLTKPMKAASPQQLSRLYADNLIWYDALTTLAQARRAKPNDKSLLADWNKLLGLPSVKLTEFASEYLTPCCALQEPRSR